LRKYPLFCSSSWTENARQAVKIRSSLRTRNWRHLSLSDERPSRQNRRLASKFGRRTITGVIFRELFVSRERQDFELISVRMFIIQYIASVSVYDGTPRGVSEQPILCISFVRE
jgi:hypothetical protein